MPSLSSREFDWTTGTTGNDAADVCVDACAEVSAIWICPSEKDDAVEALNEYLEALAGLPYASELTIVLNGAPAFAEELVSDLVSPEIAVRVVKLHRHCPESTALRAGIESSHGEFIVLLPEYLQVDAASIPQMIAELQDGFHYVASWRKHRVDSGWGEWNSQAFNALTRRVTGVRLHDVNSGLRAMRREVVSDIPIYGDLHQFFPILAEMQGFRVTETPVRHLRERVRRGDHRLGVYYRRLLNLLTLFFLFKFTKKPLRFFGLIGGASLTVGGLIIAVLVGQRLMGVPLEGRPLLLLGITSVVLGVELFSIGLLGELIIFTHGQRLLDQHVEEVEIPRNVEAEREAATAK